MSRTVCLDGSIQEAGDNTSCDSRIQPARQAAVAALSRIRSGLLFLLCGLLITAGCNSPSSDGYHELTEATASEEQQEASSGSADTARESTDTAARESATAENGAAETGAAEPSESLAQDSSPEPSALASTDAATPAPAVSPEEAADDEGMSARDRAIQAEFERARAALLGMKNPDSATEQTNEIKLLIPEKEFQREGREQALRITYDDIDLLKVLNMERVVPDVMNYVPDWLKALDGQRVVLRGWMRPGFRDEGITAFIFVRDNGTCCFGPQAKIYDKVGVRLKFGTSTRFIDGRPFDLVGTFTLKPDFEDPADAWLYFMNDAVILEQ